VPVGDLRQVHSTPLYCAFSAAFGGLGRLVGWLWDAEGNDWNVRNRFDHSLLEIASLYGTTWIVAEILKRNIDKDMVKGALFAASSDGRLDIVTFLLDQCAGLNIVSSDFDSALGIAAYHAHLDVVRLLVARGADVTRTHALEAAAKTGHLDTVRFLLDRGADINLPCPGHGTPLHAAAYRGWLHIAGFLLDRGADINYRVDGGPPLHSGAYWGHLDMCRFLLDRGADPDIIENTGEGARDCAERRGHFDIVKLLDSVTK